MGRYPFLTSLKKYLGEVKPYYAASTNNEIERKLRYANRILTDLRKRGLVSTLSPEKITEADIGAFLNWMNARDGIRSRPLAPATQEKHLVLLNTFLCSRGNTVISQMKQRKLLRVPRGQSGPLPSPSASEVDGIIRRLLDVAADGNQEAIGVLGLSVFAAYSGVRLKEVRLANRGDFSTTHWELTVYHPKGEGAYASPRRTRIVVPGRQPVQDFLDLRAKLLERHGLNDGRDVPLVPFVKYGKEVQHWLDGYLHKVKVDVEARAGVRFDFRALRRAFGQNALDRGAGIETVSVMLGHHTTKTTETYYARRKYDYAAEELDRVWASKPGEFNSP